jgi:hypothetical protein
MKILIKKDGGDTGRCIWLDSEDPVSTDPNVPKMPPRSPLKDDPLTKAQNEGLFQVLYNLLKLAEQTDTGSDPSARELASQITTELRVFSSNPRLVKWKCPVDIEVPHAFAITLGLDKDRLTSNDWIRDFP